MPGQGGGGDKDHPLTTLLLCALLELLSCGLGYIHEGHDVWDEQA